MAHTIKHKERLLNRVRRIRGQVDAIEKALEQEQGCDRLLQTIAACRGAMNGLMGEVLEDHIRNHLINVEHPPTPEQEASLETVIQVLRTYLK